MANNVDDPVPGSSSSASATNPPHSVDVINVSCEQNYTRPKAEVSVRNDGQTTIKYAKAYIQFQRKDGSVASAADSYFRPTDIPPGSMASATIYSSQGASGISNCQLVAVQDGDGQAVSTR